MVKCSKELNSFKEKTEWVQYVGLEKLLVRVHCEGRRGEKKQTSWVQPKAFQTDCSGS